MGGNRKHGYARGNRNGRNGRTYPDPWQCEGCGRVHHGRVFRTEIDGLSYCESHASRIEEARFQARRQAALEQGKVLLAATGFFKEQAP